MTTQNHFFALVKQDMKLRKQRRLESSKQWGWFYGAVILIGIIAITTAEAKAGHIQLDTHIWLFSFALPFTAFGNSIGLTKREWKNNTCGWWLSLPFSRQRLVTSKFVAALIRSVLIFAILYCVVSILAMYTMVLTHSFDASVAANFLLAGLKWEALFVLICPFTSACGILYAILGESRLRPAIPLFWLIWAGLWWLSFSRFGHYMALKAMGSAGGLHMMVPIACLMVVSWIVSFLFIQLSAYVLDKQLNV